MNYPLIVFSDHSTSIISWLIKVRTKGTYNHVMTQISDGVVASQDMVFATKDLSKYQKEGSRLLFVEIITNDRAKEAILKSVQAKLELPWHKRRYDWLGIVGQITGLKWFNRKRLEYCSEDVVEHLNAGYSEYTDELKKIIITLPKHEHPEGIKDYLLSYPEFFRIKFTWDYETGMREV
jgi:hypothetical protein